MTSANAASTSEGDREIHNRVMHTCPALRTRALSGARALAGPAPLAQIHYSQSMAQERELPWMLDLTRLGECNQQGTLGKE